MNFTPMDKMMEQWFLNDQNIDAETAKIREYTNLVGKSRQEIVDTKNTIAATKNEIQKMNEKLTNLSVDFEILKMETEAWKQTYESANEDYNQKLLLLEGIENDILDVRKSFCDDVKKFTENYGVKAMIKNIFESNVRQQLASALDDIDMNKEENQESQMEDGQIFEMGQNLEEKDKNIYSNEKFAEVNAIDEETERLLNDIKNTKDETVSFENEIVVLEKRLDEMNTDILNNLFQDEIEIKDSENNWACDKYQQGFNSTVAQEKPQFKSAKEIYESRFNNSRRSVDASVGNYSKNLATSSQSRRPNFDPKFNRTENHQPTVQDENIMAAGYLNNKNNKRFMLVKSFKK